MEESRQEEYGRAGIVGGGLPFGFGHTELKGCVVVEGDTVEDAAIKAHGRRFDRYMMDGRPCQGGAPMPRGLHSIRAWDVPGEAVTWASVGSYIISALVAAAASAAISVGVSYLLKKKPQKAYGKEMNDVSDEQYGWDYDARNAVTEGAPVPVLYGERLLTPPVVMQKARTDNGTGDSTLEVIYAVADGGGGFSDMVEYPLDADGEVQAKINHASWRNYNSSYSGSSGGNGNLMRANGVGVEVGVNYNPSTGAGGTVRPSLTDGKTSGNPVNQSSITTLHWTLKKRVSPTSVSVYSLHKRGAYKAIIGFTLYGKTLQGVWKVVGASNGYTEDDGVVVCRYRPKTPDLTAKYQEYYVGNFSWLSTAAPRGGSGEPSVTEVAMTGTTSNSGVGMNGEATIQVNQGTYSQTPHSLQDGTWASLSVEKTLDTDDFVFRTSPGGNPDRLGIHLVFPYGLYSIDDQTGEFTPKSVKISGMYRPYGSGEWLPFNGLSVGGTVISGNDQSQKMLYYEQDVSSIGAESYEVCVKFAVDPAPGTGEQCECQWAGLDEGWSFECSYPRTATALLKMLATQLINGSAPQFRILAARRTLNVYDAVNGEWVEAPASNPAWVAYDLIVRPVFDDRAPNTAPSASTLLREAYPHNGVLYSDFKSWADFCDGQGITMSMYYDGVTTVKSALEYVCDIGRAAIVNRGSVLGVYVDRRARIGADGNPDAVFSFDDSNVVQGSWRCVYRSPNDLFTQVNVTFYDKERDYNRFTVMAREDGADDGNRDQNIKDVTLLCCDDRKVAEEYADYMLKQNLIRRSFEWKGDLDAMPLDIGDVVKLYDDYVVVTGVTFDKQFGRTFRAVEYVDGRFEQKTAKQRLAEAINERMLAKSANVFASREWAATQYDGTEEASVLAAAARDAMIDFTKTAFDTSDGFMERYDAGNTGVSLTQDGFADEESWMTDCYERVRGTREIMSVDGDGQGGSTDVRDSLTYVANEVFARDEITIHDYLTPEEEARRLKANTISAFDDPDGGTSGASENDETSAFSALLLQTGADPSYAILAMKSISAALSPSLAMKATVRIFAKMLPYGNIPLSNIPVSYSVFSDAAPNAGEYTLAAVFDQPAGQVHVASRAILPGANPQFLAEQDGTLANCAFGWRAGVRAMSFDYGQSFVHLAAPKVDPPEPPEPVDDTELAVSVSGYSFTMTKTDAEATGASRVWYNATEEASLSYSSGGGAWVLSVVESGFTASGAGGEDSNPWEVEWDSEYVTVSLPE
jgi:hypothetical protein